MFVKCMYVWCRWSVSAVTFIHKTESIYCIIDTYILYTHSLLHSFRDLHSVHSEQLDYIQYAFFCHMLRVAYFFAATVGRSSYAILR